MRKKFSQCAVGKSHWLQLCIITIVYSITTVCVGSPSFFGSVHGDEMASNCGISVRCSVWPGIYFVIHTSQSGHDYWPSGLAKGGGRKTNGNIFDSRGDCLVSNSVPFVTLS